MLSNHHADEFKKSGLTTATIKRYDIKSITKDEASAELGFDAPSGGWRIAYPGSHFFKIKPDIKRGDAKYLSPSGMSQDLFVTHLAKDNINDIKSPFYFCEGEKKCLALEQAGYAAVGIAGVWNWRSRGHIIEKLLQINLSGRTCCIIFDSDKYNNKHVLHAEKSFADIFKRYGATAKIVNLNPAHGKGVDDQLLRLAKEGFQVFVDSAIDHAMGIAYAAFHLPPISLREFLKKNIPPTEYDIEGILQKSGKTMISAQANIGKSIFVQNIALQIALGKEKFLERFQLSGKPLNVLYLDLEMGESPVKDRFSKMCTEETEIPPALYVKYIADADFMKEDFQNQLERWITDLAIEVLVIDPLGNAWHGDENSKKEVGGLTAYLNTLIERYRISILVTHHFRKTYKGMPGGGEMAAGSYKWQAWIDHHITLQGRSESITISCEKSRNSARFKSFIAKINPETLCFEFIADFEPQFTEETLITLFESFNKDRVSIPEIIKLAKQKKTCSHGTVRKLIKECKTLELDDSGKTHYLCKQKDQSLFGYTDVQDAEVSTISNSETDER